jgi:maltodextrin utilization protein YvdJ
MAIPPEEEWRRVSDKIIAIVLAAPLSDRLRVFKEQLALLPESSRRMVEHFVSLAVLFNSSETDLKVAMNKNFHLSLVSVLTFVTAIILVGGGLYLVSMSGDDAMSKIKIFSAAVETSSVGVACFALAALMFLFIIRSIVAKM